MTTPQEERERYNREQLKLDFDREDKELKIKWIEEEIYPLLGD